MKRFLLCLSLPLAAACQPASFHIGSSRSPIVGGTTDTGDPSVVALYATDPNNPQAGGALCTASVITPTVLLTAAHCVLTSEIGPNAQFFVFGQSDINQMGAMPFNVTVASTHYDMAFDINNPQNGHDVGIVVLQQALTLTPLKWNQQPMSPSMTGGRVRLVGYGLSSGTMMVDTSGVRRQATTTLDDFDNMLLHIGNDMVDTCSGDSGGPAFMTIGGVETIVGVTSFGNQNCTGGGYDTRIDEYASFINQFTGTMTCTPNCTNKVCGDDGCGHPCGMCGANQTCTAAGQCMMNPPPPTLCDMNGGYETEPNDEAMQGNAFCSNGVIQGTIDHFGDLDWYTFTLTPGQSYQLTLSHLPADYEMSVFKVLSGTMTWLADADDHHDRADQVFLRKSATGGTYYVRIAGINDAFDSSNHYMLTLSHP
jgi:V8-like Glu-specific endopeptidase